MIHVNLMPSFCLRYASVLPSLSERTWNGLITDLERTYKGGTKTL